MLQHRLVGYLRTVLPAVLVAAAPAAAAAQETTVFGVGATEGDGTHLGLVGASLRPDGLGLKPVVGLQLYGLRYDAGESLLGEEQNGTVFAVTPSVGLEYRLPGGSVGARVGYSFQQRDSETDEDADLPFIQGEGGRSGVTTSVQANYWAGAPELQGIASYNWESEYVWSQAQALVPVAQMSRGGNVALGGEVIWQGQTESGLESRASSLQVGPVVRFSNGRNFLVSLGSGYKNNNGDRDDTYYARITAVRYGIGF